MSCLLFIVRFYQVFYARIKFEIGTFFKFLTDVADDILKDINKYIQKSHVSFIEFTTELFLKRLTNVIFSLLEKSKLFHENLKNH